MKYARVATLAVCAAAFAGSAMSLGAQAAPAAPKAALPTTAPLVVTLMRDIDGLAGKMVDLAKAIPADKYDWRPSAGARSVREVMLHVASDNYLLPALAGTTAPAATGIKLTDFKSVEAYEKRPLSRDSVIVELQRSFTHLANAMAKTQTSNLTETVNMFGQKSPVQDLWILTTTHLHEHLGQSIAYARSNSITPPWSK
ncbi:MAG: DinB family protein [Gemmatimonadota bacterium]